MDPAFTYFLAHLQNPTQSTTSQSLYSAIPHFLSSLPSPHPSALVLAVLASRIWKPTSLDNAVPVLNAFRQSVHMKLAAIEAEGSNMFSRSVQARLASWIESLLYATRGGSVALRLTIQGGLLMGAEDVKKRADPASVRQKLENEIIIGLAEALETDPGKRRWELEFKSAEEELVGLPLYLAAHVLPLIPSEKLTVLDLPVLIRTSVSAITSAFSEGHFLAGLLQAEQRDPDGKTSISPSSPLSKALTALPTTVVFKELPALARLVSRCVSLLTQTASRPEAWRTIDGLTLSLQSLAAAVEGDWRLSSLAGVEQEESISLDTLEFSTTLWSVLKTLLFTILLANQSIFSVVLFQPPPSESPSISGTVIAARNLTTYSHLSFILSKFGPVSSVSQLSEFKRSFFTALDVIASSDVASQDIITDLAAACQEDLPLRHPVQRARTAYFLVCAEQLMPCLEEACVEEVVLPHCYPYLSDHEHRDIYESAHSAILAVFTAHSRRMTEIGAKPEQVPSLAERLAPFYVRSLVLNSQEGRLSDQQLRVAFAALVRAAAVGGDAGGLAWYCVECLLEEIRNHRAVLSRRHSNVGLPKGDDLQEQHQQLLRLYDVLVSLIPSLPLPLPLLPKLLAAVRDQFAEIPEGKETLSESVFNELMERVGDGDKDLVMNWWLDGKEAGVFSA